MGEAVGQALRLTRTLPCQLVGWNVVPHTLPPLHPAMMTSIPAPPGSMNSTRSYLPHIHTFLPAATCPCNMLRPGRYLKPSNSPQPSVNASITMQHHGGTIIRTGSSTSCTSLSDVPRIRMTLGASHPREEHSLPDGVQYPDAIHPLSHNKLQSMPDI